MHEKASVKLNYRMSKYWRESELAGEGVNVLKESPVTKNTVSASAVLTPLRDVPIRSTDCLYE